MKATYNAIELADLLDKLRELGHGQLLDALTDASSEGPYCRNGRVNKSKLARATGMKPNELTQRLASLQADANTLTDA